MRIWCRPRGSNWINLPFSYRYDDYLGNYQVSLKHFGVYFYTLARMLAEILFSAFDNSNINYLSRIHDVSWILMKTIVRHSALTNSTAVLIISLMTCSETALPIKIWSISLYFPDCLFGEDRRRKQSGAKLLSPTIIFRVMRFNIWVRRGILQSQEILQKHDYKFHPYFALITITFLQVLFINYVFSGIENMKNGNTELH